MSIEQLASLALEHREALYGTRKILTTTLRIAEKGTRNGRHYVRVKPTGRADLRIFITSATDDFDKNTRYAYVRVEVDRFFFTNAGMHELWLTHID